MEFPLVIQIKPASASGAVWSAGRAGAVKMCSNLHGIAFRPNHKKIQADEKIIQSVGPTATDRGSEGEHVMIRRSQIIFG